MKKTLLIFAILCSSATAYANKLSCTSWWMGQSARWTFAHDGGQGISVEYDGYDPFTKTTGLFLGHATFNGSTIIINFPGEPAPHRCGRNANSQPQYPIYSCEMPGIPFSNYILSCAK
jgi:hypothetical protein